MHKICNFVRILKNPFLTITKDNETFRITDAKRNAFR